MSPRFDRLDRRMSVLFGTLLVAVLLLVFVTATVTFLAISAQHRRQLAASVASTLGASVERVSLSGRHHTRLLLERLVKDNPTIVFIQVVDEDRLVLAHSQDQYNDQRVDHPLIERAFSELTRGSQLLDEHTQGDTTTTEVVTAVSAGYNAQVRRVVHVAVRGESAWLVARTATWMGGGALLILLLLTMPLVTWLSRRISAPVKTLAADLDGILRHAPILVAVEDEGTELARVSQAYQAHLESPTKPLRSALRGLGGGAPEASGELRISLDGGPEPRIFLATRFPLAWEPKSGQVNRTCTLGTDVTELREAQAERDRLAQAVIWAADQVVVTQPDGTIVYTNPAFTEITGYSRAEALGQNPRILKSPSNDPALYAELWATITRGQPWRGRLTNRRKTGEDYRCELTVSPMFDDAGAISAYVAVARDASREAALEQQLLQAQKLDAVGRLAGGIAHDFNNLLTIIMGECAIMEMDFHPAQRLDESYKTIGQAAQRAADLTRKLLAFSRQQNLKLRPVQLGQVLQGAIKLVSRGLGEGIELDFQADAERWLILADVGQMEQVLMNLAINARDAMGGRGKLSVEVRNRTLASPHNGVQLLAGDYVTLTVTDCGQGIEPEHLSRVFEPFFTTKPVGQGTGLGLATVHGIVTQCGGYVWVNSERGKGSVFEVALPRLKAEVMAELHDSQEVVPAGRGECVLIVEDEALVRQTLVRLLKPAGYRVLEAESGAQALELLNQVLPDVVVSDLVMPGMTGAELALAARARYPKLPFAFLSGYGEVDSPSLDGAPLLRKPPSLPELHRTLRRLLDCR